MTPIELNIRELREKKGWTQQELADKAGLYQATISNLESGRSRRIEFDKLDAIAEALGVQPGDLIVKE